MMKTNVNYEHVDNKKFAYVLEEYEENGKKAVRKRYLTDEELREEEKDHE